MRRRSRPGAPPPAAAPQNPEKRAAALRKARRTFAVTLLLALLMAAVMAVSAHAAEDLSINISSGEEAGGLGALEVIFILAFLSLLPAVFLMFTSFTRIIIVLSFARSAMGTAQSPPNMILTGLAIFLTLFIMTPTITEMNEVAFQPFQDGELDTQEALDAAAVPLKRFMLDQTDLPSLNAFVEMAGREQPEEPEEYLALPMTVIAPAFIVSEISRAFWMGFLIYLPFLVVDMVISSILMSMGMVMLPPAMIALPFKILLFVLIDGWNMLMGTMVDSYLG